VLGTSLLLPRALLGRELARYLPAAAVVVELRRELLLVAGDLLLVLSQLHLAVVVELVVLRYPLLVLGGWQQRYGRIFMLSVVLSGHLIADLREVQLINLFIQEMDQSVWLALARELVGAAHR